MFIKVLPLITLLELPGGFLKMQIPEPPFQIPSRFNKLQDHFSTIKSENLYPEKSTVSISKSSTVWLQRNNFTIWLSMYICIVFVFCLIYIFLQICKFFILCIYIQVYSTTLLYHFFSLFKYQVYHMGSFLVLVLIYAMC